MFLKKLVNYFKPVTVIKEQPLTIQDKRLARRQNQRFLQLLFAAWHFLNTSRDGAVIAQIVGVQPIKLYRWSIDDNDIWISALHYWNPDWTGPTEIEGEYFKHVVGETIVERDLKKAQRMWTAIAQVRETKEMQKTLLRFDEMDFTE